MNQKKELQVEREYEKFSNVSKRLCINLTSYRGERNCFTVKHKQKIEQRQGTRMTADYGGHSPSPSGVEVGGWGSALMAMTQKFRGETPSSKIGRTSMWSPGAAPSSRYRYLAGGRERLALGQQVPHSGRFQWVARSHRQTAVWESNVRRAQ